MLWKRDDMNRVRLAALATIVVAALMVGGCDGETGSTPGPTAAPTEAPTPAPTAEPGLDRINSVPLDAVKVTPEDDEFPPILHSEEYLEPVPVPSPVNTAGAEDSAFVTPDGRTLYIWFTPDPSIPVTEQLVDGVTGVYVSYLVEDEWTLPERVWLQDQGKLALDGCVFVQGETMWFGSAREGYEGLNWFTAEYVDGEWRNWEYAGDLLNKEYQVGELHVTADGRELYYHTRGEQYDIWVSENVGGQWQQPEPVDAVNSPDTEGWPFVTEDGQELWFTRFYQGSPAIFRSTRVAGEWQEPELVISQFAGEPTLDREGNIYFSHHFYVNGEMVESDIYVAYRK